MQYIKDLKYLKFTKMKAYCRNSIYMFFQILVCPTCGQIMICTTIREASLKFYSQEYNLTQHPKKYLINILNI